VIRINIIGSGNMAWFLADSFAKTDVSISDIFSRNKEQGQLLADACNANFVNDVACLDDNADITFIALRDDDIALVANQLKTTSIVAHCSGMLSMDALSAHKDRAVFYPLQTITKNDLPNASHIPICLEANNTETLRIVESLADKISHHVHFINSEQRQYYHLAAVMVNNFTNHLYVLADDLLTKQNLSFDLLKPLISETARKACISKPLNNQTGPAKRDDRNTIKKHLNLLNQNKELKELYEKITQSIFKLQQQDEI
jgi:predicted short-subunit dehydrogenase-like oxidoreductase (DUF2520 family)